MVKHNSLGSKVADEAFFTMSLTDKQRVEMKKAVKKIYEDLNKEWFPHKPLRMPSNGSFNDELMKLCYSKGYTAAVNRECGWVWVEDESHPLASGYRTSCKDGILQDVRKNYCPNCGGKVVEVRNG